LAEKTFGDLPPSNKSSSSNNSNGGGGNSDDGASLVAGSITGANSSTSKSKRGTVVPLPSINNNNNNNGGGGSVDGDSASSVAASLVEQHLEETQRKEKDKTRSVKPEDIPQQHYVEWESLNQCRKMSKWHGPFNSDGAAHRHLHNALDLSHTVFEVLLRQPFTTV
jgi:hypothetical protein